MGSGRVDLGRSGLANGFGRPTGRLVDDDTRCAKRARGIA